MGKVSRFAAVMAVASPVSAEERARVRAGFSVLCKREALPLLTVRVEEPVEAKVWHAKHMGYVDGLAGKIGQGGRRRYGAVPSSAGRQRHKASGAMRWGRQSDRWVDREIAAGYREGVSMGARVGNGRPACGLAGSVQRESHSSLKREAYIVTSAGIRPVTYRSVELGGSHHLASENGGLRMSAKEMRESAAYFERRVGQLQAAVAAVLAQMDSWRHNPHACAFSGVVRVGQKSYQPRYWSVVCEYGFTGQMARQIKGK